MWDLCKEELHTMSGTCGCAGIPGIHCSDVIIVIVGHSMKDKCKACRSEAVEFSPYLINESKIINKTGDLHIAK